MKKIRVLMAGWEYPPYVTGGLGTHCYYLINALTKLGVKVYLTTPHPLHKKRRNFRIVGLDITQNFKEEGKIVNYGPKSKDKIRLYTEKICDGVKGINFDVIHCQDVPPISASIKLKEHSNKPLVLTVHSTVYDRKEKPPKKDIENEKRGMEHADRIIAVSHYTKDIIVNKFKINPRKVSVVINAIRQRKIKLKKKQGKTKYVLYLGRLHYQKGIPYLIKAAKKVIAVEKNVKFLIAGGGKQSHVTALKNQAKKLGLEKNIIFLGYVRDKKYYYRKASILVMPSISEPFGIVPLESIINGTPAIISKQSGIVEVLKSCLKFNYWDVDDLTKKLLFLLRNKKAYEKLRRDGIKEVKKFTWESIGKETINVYRKVLGSKNLVK